MDNDAVLKAIDNYQNFSLLKRELLKTLIKLSVDDTVTVKIEFLMEKLQTSKTSMYYTLNSLQHDGIISKTYLKHTFKINRDKIKLMEEIYFKMQQLQR